MMAAFRWTDAAVRKALGLETSDEGTSVEFDRVSTDSRSTAQGDLFVALQGPHFDGHAFVEMAVEQGARGAVVTREVAADAATYRVDDTLDALGRLAAYRRHALGAKVVAVTGSSGKTGTKEFLKAAIGAAFRTHATRGNLNNRVGLPLTILGAPEDTEVLVLEAGTNEPGEIAALAKIAHPDVAIVTTVSETHLEGLGSLEGVLTEKLDLLRHMGEDALALVGERPVELRKNAQELVPEVLVAGFSTMASETLRPEEASPRADGCWNFEWRGHEVALQVPGKHQVVNALLALGAAEALGVPAAAAAEAISAVEPQPLRGERRRVGRVTLFIDCYNANPQSTRAAVDVVTALAGHDRPSVAVLGSMLELGDRADELHRSVLADAVSGKIDIVVATGDFAAAATDVEPAEGVQLVVEADPDAAYDALRPLIGGGEVVLLKGSRGVALEALIPRFEADFRSEEEE